MPVTLNIAAACLMDSAGRLLLVRKRGTRAFMLPGGKREAGEQPLDALRRELREELDLHLPADALAPLGRFHAPAANEADTWVDADIYLAALPHPVQPAAELEELAWLNDLHETSESLAPLLRDKVLPALRERLA
ncbi:hypothetical protein D3C76_837810 [compost metagenome]